MKTTSIILTWFILLSVLSCKDKPVENTLVNDIDSLAIQFNEEQNEKYLCDVEFDKILHQIDQQGSNYLTLSSKIDSLKKVYPNRIPLWIELKGMLELSKSNYSEASKLFSEIIDMKVSYTIHVFALRAIAKAKMGFCEDAFIDLEILKESDRYTEDSTNIAKICQGFK
jgi:hypothetical protein